MLPFRENVSRRFPGRRVLRVQGGSKTFEELVADLEVVRGTQYYVEYRNPAEANALEEKARQEGDEAGEMH